MNPVFLLWSGGSEGASPPSPEITAELQDISQAFDNDYRRMHLLPHEARQLRRIVFIAKRDEKAAITALRIFKRRATMMRKTLRRAGSMNA